MKRCLLAAFAIIVAESTLRFAWPRIDDNDPLPGFELQLGIVAVLMAFALPHLVAFSARGDRLELLLPAGLIGLVMTFFSSISFFLLVITVPLVLLPSLVYLVTWGIGAGRPTMANPGLVPMMVLMGTGALLVLMAAQDARCMIATEAEGGGLNYRSVDVSVAEGRLSNEIVSAGCSSDVIAFHESLISLALSGLVIATARGDGRRRLNDLRVENPDSHAFFHSGY